MSNNASSITNKFMWTTGSYGVSLALRFSISIVQARLLGPEIMGVVVIVQAVRIGTELLSDIGMEQNVVNSPNGDDPRFLNTVWTVQILRGLVVSAITAALCVSLAHFYGIPLEIMLAISIAPLLSSFVSTSVHSLSRNLAVKTRSLFDLGTDALALLINLGLALAMPTVWAPVLGMLLGIAARSALSYLLPHPAHRLVFDREHIRAIINFGKWIMLSSLAFYASMYLDRLFLGQAVPLALLGVYGLARTISVLPLSLAGKLAFQIVFPVIAAERDGTNLAAQKELATTRLRFLLLVAVGMAIVMATSDWAVLILYGDRYHEAGWMLLLLLVGSWVGVLSSLSEAAVLGYSRPQIVSVGNMSRIGVMAVALPAGFYLAGLPGAILGLAVGELARYLILLIAQQRLGKSATRQDVSMTLALVIAFGAFVLAREALGLGVPWASLQ